MGSLPSPGRSTSGIVRLCFRLKGEWPRLGVMLPPKASRSSSLCRGIVSGHPRSFLQVRGAVLLSLLDRHPLCPTPRVHALCSEVGSEPVYLALSTAERMCSCVVACGHASIGQEPTTLQLPVFLKPGEHGVLKRHVCSCHAPPPWPCILRRPIYLRHCLPKELTIQNHHHIHTHSRTNRTRTKLTYYYVFDSQRKLEHSVEICANAQRL